MWLDWILQSVRKPAKNWYFSAGFGGTFQPDWVALLLRIRWHFSTGLSGTFAPEYAEEYNDSKSTYILTGKELF